MNADRTVSDLFFADGDELSFPRSEDQAYFRQLEEHFLALRGSPLTLSELDSRLAKSWFEEGIPVELVCRTIEEVFEKRRSAGKDKVSSLRYLKSAVARAWKRHQEMNATVEGQAASHVAEPSLDLPARLGRLADSLPEALPEIDRWREEIRSLGGDPEQIEEALAELDTRVLRESEAHLGPEQHQEVEARLTAALEALATRLPRDELERASASLREQILRKWLGLPILSLFASLPLIEEDGSEEEESGSRT